MKYIVVAALIVTFALSAKEVFGNSNVSFRLSAKNLPLMDPLGGRPDPYVILTYQNPPNPPFELGRTSILQDTQEPNWPDIFDLVYFQSSQELKFDVYDEDFDEDDYIGGLRIKLEDIVSTFGGILERDIIFNNSTINGQLKVSANITQS